MTDVNHDQSVPLATGCSYGTGLAIQPSYVSVAPNGISFISHGLCMAQHTAMLQLSGCELAAQITGCGLLPRVITDYQVQSRWLGDHARPTNRRTQEVTRRIGGGDERRHQHRRKGQHQLPGRHRSLRWCNGNLSWCQDSFIMRTHRKDASKVSLCF